MLERGFLGFSVLFCDEIVLKEPHFKWVSRAVELKRAHRSLVRYSV